MAGTILVAQYKGKKDNKSIDYISSQTLTTMLGISVILAAFGYFAGGSLINLIGADASIASDATSYLQISFLGMPFLFGYFMFQSLLRGIGEVKIPMLIVLGTVILNSLMDPLLIMGYGPIPGFGVSGAAMATIFTQGIATIIGIALLFGGKYGIHIHTKDMKPDFSLIKKMFKLGFPSSIEQSTRALGILVMTILVASFGTVSLAAYGIGSRIFSFIIIPAVGLAMATSTLVGQNIGAGKPERAAEITKTSAFISFVILTGVGILVFIFAKNLSAFFIPGETEAIESSALFIRIISLTFGFIGVQQVLSGALRGAGRTLVAMTMAIVALWILQFPTAFFLSKFTTLAEKGIWWAFPFSNIIAVIITMLCFASGKWKEKKLTEEIQIKKRVTEESIIEEG